MVIRMPRARSRGFSLIELMVVMAIIAALVAIAAPRYQGSVENAKVIALKSSLWVLRDGIERYNEDRGAYPAGLDALVEARYIKAVPVDAVTGSATTWVTVPGTDADGIVDVRSGARGSTVQGVPYADL